MLMCSAVLPRCCAAVLCPASLAALSALLCYANALLYRSRMAACVPLQAYRGPWGPRVQRRSIVLMRGHNNVMACSRAHFNTYEGRRVATDVGYSTLCPYYSGQYAETPYETKLREQRDRRATRTSVRRGKLNEEALGSLRRLMEDQSALYSDEIEEVRFIRSTIWRALKERLGWLLRLVTRIAKERD